MITKEEVQAQIGLIKIIESRKGFPNFIEEHLEFLYKFEKNLRSIKDLQREAFEAAREKKIEIQFEDFMDEPFELPVDKFKTFEDYFKTLKTE